MSVGLVIRRLGSFCLGSRTRLVLIGRFVKIIAVVLVVPLIVDEVLVIVVVAFILKVVERRDLGKPF